MNQYFASMITLINGCDRNTVNESVLSMAKTRGGSAVLAPGSRPRVMSHKTNNKARDDPQASRLARIQSSFGPDRIESVTNLTEGVSVRETALSKFSSGISKKRCQQYTTMQQSGGGPLHLPGFFYDTEKRKYFRIQADHQAPANAKYSASQVARGERETKKRRSAVEDEQVRSRQTVRRSAALLDPQTGGIGLAREIGIHKSSESRSERDAAFVAGLQPATLRVTPPNDTCEQGSLFDVATSFSDIGFRQRGTHYLLGYNHMFGSSVHDALYDRDQAWEPLTSTPG